MLYEHTEFVVLICMLLARKRQTKYDNYKQLSAQEW